MKHSASYERKFKSLLARLKKAYDQPPPAALTDPTEEFVWSTLLEDSSEGTAKVALSRLTGQFVDLNEVRVSRPEELAEALPGTLSDPPARARRIIDGLRAIYNRADALDIGYLREQPKREARNFVASLPQVSPFVEGRVCLLSLNVFAMPVDRTLVALLQARGAIHPDSDPKDTQGFLERIVPAKEALGVAMLLEALRQNPDNCPPAARPRKAARKRTEAAR